MTYPVSLRRKVLAHIEEETGKREAARLFKISPKKALIPTLIKPGINIIKSSNSYWE